jgi:type II secretory pathway pseudopilin PulG
MKSKSNSAGFTLVEVLVSALILTTILGTLFSVLTALRKSANYRNKNLAVTQATNFAFDSRNLKAGNLVESLWDPTIAPGGACKTVRGFYIIENGQVRDNINISNLDINQKLAVISRERQNNGTYFYLKREYAIGPNDPDSTGTAYPTIIETTYRASTDPSVNGGLGWEWPVRLYVPPGQVPPCSIANNTSLHWDQDPSRITTRKLTANSAKVTKFGIRMNAPLITPANLELLNSPYITLEITTAHPTDATVPTFTLTSTITPTFAYGDQLD